MESLPKRLKANKYILYTLNKAKPKLRKAIIKNSDDALIKALSEISLNTLNGNLELTGGAKNKLKKYKRKLRCIACPKRKLKSKRNILVQEGGFLPVLISSLLSSVIGALLEKHG